MNNSVSFHRFHYQPKCTYSTVPLFLYSYCEGNSLNSTFQLLANVGSSTCNDGYFELILKKTDDRSKITWLIQWWKASTHVLGSISADTKGLQVFHYSFKSSELKIDCIKGSGRCSVTWRFMAWIGGATEVSCNPPQTEQNRKCMPITIIDQNKHEYLIINLRGMVTNFHSPHIDYLCNRHTRNVQTLHKN